MSRFRSNRQRRFVMQQISARKLLGFAREEKATAKQYAQLGFPSQARDERKHARFFKKKAKIEGEVK